jgi:hypothetical protein
MTGTPTVAKKATTAKRARRASHYHETWVCGSCGRSFGDCTSCCAHESQCGGQISHC